MSFRLALAIALLTGPAATFAQAGGRVIFGGYGEAVYNRLTGVSTGAQLRAGYRHGPHEFHVIFRNDTFDTRGSDFPFQYASRGATAGLGYRYYFTPDDKAFVTVSTGTGLDGDNRGRPDHRVGLVMGEYWENGNSVGDLYAEVFWLSRAEDALATVRVRPGVLLQRDENSRLWAYGVAQIWASHQRRSGAENRMEAGVGMGYNYRGQWGLNVELRAGYSYAGVIDRKTYVNPWVIFSTGF